MTEQTEFLASELQNLLQNPVLAPMVEKLLWCSEGRIGFPVPGEQGLLLRINRSIQSEGAFGVLKEDRHFRRLKRRGTEGVFTEILLYAFAYDVEKLYAKTQQDRSKTMLFVPDTA